MRDNLEQIKVSEICVSFKTLGCRSDLLQKSFCWLLWRLVDVCGCHHCEWTRPVPARPVQTGSEHSMAAGWSSSSCCSPVASQNVASYCTCLFPSWIKMGQNAMYIFKNKCYPWVSVTWRFAFMDTILRTFDHIEQPCFELLIAMVTFYIPWNPWIKGVSV